MSVGIPERVQYLLGSPERIRLLDALAEGPIEQRRLDRACSIARSTVHRNLAGFEQRGWVVDGDDGYALTPAGERILEAYTSFADTVGTLTEHEQLLAHLGEAADPLPMTALEGCETTLPTETNPHAPSIAAANAIRNNAGDQIRVAIGTVCPITRDARAQAIEAGSDVETVVDRPTFETLRNAARETTETVLDHDRARLFVSTVPIDTEVVIAGDDVCVVVHDEDGTTRACLSGSNPELRAWATRVYGRVRDGADPVRPSARPVAVDD